MSEINEEVQVAQKIIQGETPDKSILEQLDEDTQESIDAVVDLIERDFTGLDDQGAFAELVRGLAFAENDFATAFVAEIQDGEDMKDKALSAASEANLPEEAESSIDNTEPGGTS